MPAILARSVQHDIVRGHDVPMTVCDALDRRLEHRIRERFDLPAIVADEVVVMVVRGLSRLEAGDAVTEVDALHETERGHSLERAVHARDADPRAPRPRLVVELVRGQAAVLLPEDLHHDPARASAAPGRLTETHQRRFGPRHADNDTRSQRRARFWFVRSTLLAVVLLVSAGCAGSDSTSRRAVVAAFYPLAWATEQLTRGSMDVVNLTPPGVEPHDIELSPSEIETVRDAELVVYVGGGFQPALEDAVAQRDGDSLDVLYGDSDPHVWLDPVRFARSVAGMARRLEGVESARPPLGQLKRLHSQYRRGLADCERRIIVTTHAAFGHLATRYGLTQLSLAGSSPEAEPSPRELEELIDDVRASGATTVFTEPLVSDEVAETVAREADLAIETLDPVEGLSEERLAAGEDYLSVMRSNLANLREALGCR